MAQKLGVHAPAQIKSNNQPSRFLALLTTLANRSDGSAPTTTAVQLFRTALPPGACGYNLRYVPRVVLASIECDFPRHREPAPFHCVHKSARARSVRIHTYNTASVKEISSPPPHPLQSVLDNIIYVYIHTYDVHTHFLDNSINYSLLCLGICIVVSLIT